MSFDDVGFGLGKVVNREIQTKERQGAPVVACIGRIRFCGMSRHASMKYNGTGATVLLSLRTSSCSALLVLEEYR